MIEGIWTILGVEYGGQALPARTGTLRIAGARFSLEFERQAAESGATELDLAATPMTLDLIWREDGGAESRRLRTIVRVRGDLMQLCYFPSEAPGRPQAFASPASDESPPAVLIRCRRRPA